MNDALAVLASLTTVTATYTSASVNTVNGSALRGVKVDLIVTNASVGTTGTAAESVLPTIQVSSDNTTFRTLYTGKSIPMVVAAATAEQSLEFVVPKNEPYYQLVMTFAGNATLPTVSFKANVSDGREACSVF